MLRKESKTAALSWNKTRRLNEQKKKKKNKNNSTKTKQTAAAAGGPRRNPRRSEVTAKYAEAPAEEFMLMFDDDGMSEEDKQRLKASLADTDSGASGDEQSATEVIPSPPGLSDSSMRFLRKRDDAGAGGDARF